MNTTTTKIAGEAMTDDAAAFEAAFKASHEYPEQADQLEFRKGWEARALLASKPAVPADDVIDLAVALEQRRALHIVAAVRQQGFSKSGTAIPTQAESVFDLACEEIEHRLRTETWELAGVTGPLPTAPAQSADALTRELLDTLQMMVQHFTKTPSTLADPKARGKAHEVIAKAYEQIGYAAPAQSCGEDAANGAIGEREAFENCLNAGTFDVDRVSDFHDFEIEAAWRGWQARAALTAEKVAAEPVAVVLADEGIKLVAFLNGSAASLDEGDLLYRRSQPAQTQVALTDFPDAVLSAIDERAATNTDDWAERQPVEPTKETCNAMYVREVVRLLSIQVR